MSLLQTNTLSLFYFDSFRQLRLRTHNSFEGNHKNSRDIAWPRHKQLHIPYDTFIPSTEFFHLKRTFLTGGNPVPPLPLLPAVIRTINPSKVAKMAPRGSQKAIFKECIVARAGDLGKSDWPDDKIDQWISIHGGEYLRSLDQLRPNTTTAQKGDADSNNKITHVLATKELYAKMSAPRRKTFLKDDVFVVTCDWLEDSINKKRKLREKEFRLDLVWHEEKRKRAEKVRVEERAERGGDGG